MELIAVCNQQITLCHMDVLLTQTEVRAALHNIVQFQLLMPVTAEHFTDLIRSVHRQLDRQFCIATHLIFIQIKPRHCYHHS